MEDLVKSEMPPAENRSFGLISRRGFLSFRNIRAKAALYVMLLLTATIFLSYRITLRIMNAQLKKEIIQRAESLSQSIASTAGYHIVLKDLLALDNMVFKIKSSNPDITSIAIIGEDNEITVHSDTARRGEKIELPEGAFISSSRANGTLTRELAPPPEGFFTVESPVVFLDKNLGSVILEVNWSALAEVQANARRRIFGVFGFIFILGMISSTILSSRLTRPIKELASGVAELKQGRRSKPLRVYSSDELGKLTASFNEMSELITSQKEKLADYAHELERAYVSTVRVLAAAIEARDRYTLGHSTRVAEMAIAIAREIGLDAEKVEEIEIACLFHDVGKIKIPDAILHKMGRLNSAELEEMKKHVEYGAEILSKAPSLYKYIAAVRHHHEWFNGTGYPDGLNGHNIPVAAAVISLSDAYDAMTSDRPYRKALSQEEALEIIRMNAGKQFDPELTAVFLRIFKKQNLASAKINNVGCTVKL